MEQKLNNDNLLSSQIPFGKKHPDIVSIFDGKHESFIHDMRFDYYGRRIAICSSDQTISIWDADSMKSGDFNRSYQYF